MELHKIRGGNREELENKKYNIGVGISLGNKWFTVENIIELILWCLPRTREYVVVYVADSIHAINLEVRNKINFEKALQKAERQGDEILGKVKSRIEQDFPSELSQKIVYVKWNQIADEKYKQKVDYLRSLYNSNSDFNHAIRSVVKNFISKEERIFSEAEIQKLGEYIIEELPEVINRVSMGGVVCDAYTYPSDGELCELVEQIQKGEKFSEIKEKIMDTAPKVFLEVR